MANLTSSLTVKLIDDVSKPARTVAEALRDAEKAARDVAKGMAGTGATDRFVKSLSGLKATRKDIEQVAAAWRDYSKSAGLAANSAQWTKKQAADVRVWERSTLSALRTVKREQAAFARSLGKAGGGAVSPMMLAMSQSTLANRRMIAGMSSAGGRKSAPGKIGAAEMAASAGLFGGMGLGQIAAGYYGYEAARKIATGGVERQHARVSALNAGMTPEELRVAERASVAATRYAPTMSASEIMELVQDIRSSVQEEKDLYRILPQAARAASILKGMGAGNANIGDIVKAGDTLGLLTEPQRFEKFLAGQVKSMAVLGRTVTTEQVYEAAKYSKSAGATLSDRFLNLTLPGLIQEMRGSSAGDTLSMLTKTLRGGLQNRHLSVQKLEQMGLLAEPGMITRNKSGDIKGYAGKLVGDNLLASDPDKWFQEIFKPAAAKIGVQSQADMVKLLSEILPSRAANLGRILMQQEQSLKTQAKLFESTPDMDRMIANQRSDPKASWSALKAATLDLGAAALEAVPAAQALSSLADGLRSFSAGLGEVKKFFGVAAQVDAEKKDLGQKATVLDAWRRYNTQPIEIGTSYREAFAGYRVPPKPTFQTMPGAGLSRRAWARDANAASFGVTGGMGGANALPSFAQMTVKPTVDTSGLDTARLKADEAKTALQGLNVSVTPNVNSGSIDIAIGKAQQLLSLLNSVGAAANSAAAAAGTAANAAGSAAAKISALGKIQRGNFSYGGVQGE